MSVHHGNEEHPQEKYFLAIYKEYFPLLFNYGMHITHQREIVKDCIQDLFIDLRNNLDNLEKIRSVKFYLIKALRRRIVKVLAKESKQVYALPTHSSFLIEWPHENRLIHNQAVEEQKEKLLRSFEKLTKRQKEAIFLRFNEGLDYAEIAAAMQLEDVKSARNLIYKSLKTLRKEIILSGIIAVMVLLISLIN